MFTTKVNQLREYLSCITPAGASYDDYISNFSITNCCSFLINPNNVDLVTIINHINELGFSVIMTESNNKKHILMNVIELK